MNKVSQLQLERINKQLKEIAGRIFPAAIIEKLDDSKTEKETTSASEGGPGTVKPKETEKAETAADESSKGPGVQKTTENSENDNVSGENTGNTDPIGPGV